MSEKKSKEEILELLKQLASGASGINVQVVNESSLRMPGGLKQWGEMQSASVHLRFKLAELMPEKEYTQILNGCLHIELCALAYLYSATQENPDKNKEELKATMKKSFNSLLDILDEHRMNMAVAWEKFQEAEKAKEKKSA